MLIKLIILISLLIVPFFNKETSDINIVYNYVDRKIYSVFHIEKTKFGPYTGDDNNQKVIKSYYGPMTAYGPDCVGCIGITASGYDVLNGKIFYNDLEYGNIRIVAADKSLPFGTIVKISGLKDYKEGLIAIVLDRGSAIGFSKNSYFDLLYKSEQDTLTFGCQYATFEILRLGY